MEKIFMKYNPFKLEFDIRKGGEDGDKFDESSSIYSNKGKRLQLWVNGFTQELFDGINDDFELTFKGTMLDYLDLKEDVDSFNETKNGKVELKHEEVASSEDRLENLKDLFDYMQKTSPFEDLKEKRVVENFNKAMSNEFEIAVIATMSSGKSTLLNALLGMELMPSKNEACTATVARIKDIDQADFTALSRDKDENIIDDKVKKVSAATISNFNDNPEVSYIDIEGNIPFVESHNIQLVLLDTPGPNNSRDEKHKEKTFSVIKNSEPMVIYVLNATQLSTNDDNTLLDAVSEATKEGGKQSMDRFMFVVNKVDCFDTEKGESVEGALQNVVDYLKNHGIENPNIYLTSSEMAKVIRLKKNNYELSRKQKQTYSDLERFIDEEELHLEKYAHLSNAGKIKLKEYKRDAKDNADLALIHTGIPTIEIAINEYLEKYAIATKVNQAVSAFIGQINSKNMESNLIESIKGDEEKIKELNIKLEAVSKQIEDGKEAQKFKQKIENLNLDKEVEKLTNDFVIKINNEIYKLKPNKEHGYEYEANEYIKNFDSKIKDLQPKVKVELECIINETIKEAAEKYIKEYKKYLASMLEELDIEYFNSKEANIGEMFIGALGNTDDILSGFIESVTVDSKTVSDATWWKPWTWFKTKEIDVKDDMVNLQSFYTERVEKINIEFNKSVKAATSEAKELSEEFKKYFSGEIDKLDKKLGEKVDYLKETTSDRDKVEKSYNENMKKQEWLKDFIEKLNKVLEI